MTPSSVQMSNPFAHSVSWALVTHSLSTTNFFPLLPKLKFHFHGNTRTLNKKVVESVAVALPWVAVQIQMTLPALRSVRSRGGGGCIYGIRLHQHPPAVSSQRHWEYLHVREIATGGKTKVPVLPSCAGGFGVFSFFQLWLLSSASADNKDGSESVWFLSSRGESTRSSSVTFVYPTVTWNFHQFRGTKADWAYLHSSTAVMKLVWWKSENFAVSQEPLIFQSGDRIREGLFGVVNENTISRRWHSLVACA